MSLNFRTSITILQEMHIGGCLKINLHFKKSYSYYTFFEKFVHIVTKFIQSWKAKWQSRDWTSLQVRSRNSAWTHTRCFNLCLVPYWWNYPSLKFEIGNIILLSLLHQRCGEFSPHTYLHSSECNICWLICAIVSCR